jgi:hypothetical protein
MRFEGVNEMNMHKVEMVCKRLGLLLIILGIFYVAGCGGGGGVKDDPPVHIPPDTPPPGDVYEYANQITKSGITFYFDKMYPIGTFANGDFWVAGDEVVITKITPDFRNEQNGWEVNPKVEGGQGFTKDVRDYNSSLVPELPYTAKPTSSIVKSIRSSVAASAMCRRCVESAVVLTVISEPIDGTKYFRPPYVGEEKPFIPVADLRTDLLPSLEPVEQTPLLDDFPEIKNIQMCHKVGGGGIGLNPNISYRNEYGAAVGTRNADIALRLMLNDSIEEKMPLLIAYVQYGIDLYHMVKQGYVFKGGGGHDPGKKLPPVFAAVMLDDLELKQVMMSKADVFHETYVLRESHDKERILFGSDWEVSASRLEEAYWKVVFYYVTTGYPDGGNKAIMDPYGYIDGGPRPGTAYQYCCSSKPWKGSILAIKLMPELAVVWNDDVTTRYVERWVNFGAWASPDPCAPVLPDYDWDRDYGVKFGPDPDKPGDCIRGSGRFTEHHGLYTDEGYHSSRFVDNLWERYIRER